MKGCEPTVATSIAEETLADLGVSHDQLHKLYEMSWESCLAPKTSTSPVSSPPAATATVSFAITRLSMVGHYRLTRSTHQHRRSRRMCRR